MSTHNKHLIGFWKNKNQIYINKVSLFNMNIIVIIQNIIDILIYKKYLKNIEYKIIMMKYKQYKNGMNNK